MKEEKTHSKTQILTVNDVLGTADIGLLTLGPVTDSARILALPVTDLGRNTRLTCRVKKERKDAYF